MKKQYLYRRQQAKYSERIKEVEKINQEESLQLQERATNAIKDLETKMKELKCGTYVVGTGSVWPKALQM